MLSFPRYLLDSCPSPRKCQPHHSIPSFVQGVRTLHFHTPPCPGSTHPALSSAPYIVLYVPAPSTTQLFVYRLLRRTTSTGYISLRPYTCNSGDVDEIPRPRIRSANE
ncbi:hypothetical protein C8R44DRAFT_817830 [Mycena epipterygia]|nr:hypothetical protein C8R44DRAFT_817830 [Mycena epipterygia]